MLADYIFIYHLDAELQKLYIQSARYNIKKVNEIFSHILRMAFLLCKKSLLIPASHFFESDIAYNNISFFNPLLEYDAIHLLSQSGNLDLFLQKKMEEHEGSIDSEQFHYRDYYKNEKGLYLPGRLRKRKKSSSKELEKDWIRSIGNENIWGPYFEEIDYQETFSEFEEKLSKVPERLGRKAYISQYILPLLEVKPTVEAPTDRFINVFITREYIKNYLLEFKSATALKDIPLIDSEEILPHISGREYISYSEYINRLQGHVYHERPVKEYVMNCSALELYEFKYSKEWNNILYPQIPYNKYWNGGMNMNTLPQIKTAVIFALSEEFAAFKALTTDFRELDAAIEKEINMRGHIAKVKGSDKLDHMIGLFLLPEYGNNMSGIYVTELLNTFPTIEHIIMCGIAGGIPAKEHIGDVVVSTEGVFQYDFGKNTSEKFIPKDRNASCSLQLIQAVKLLQVNQFTKPIQWNEYYSQLRGTIVVDFITPPEKEACFMLDTKTNAYKNITRKGSSVPKVFYEKIGTANCVQKDPAMRDALFEERKIYAIEMEAGGIKDSARVGNKGFLVVRGICDFCDDNKSDDFHGYASMTAAIYTIELLKSMQDF